jgi:hypothetical protein
MYTRLGSLQKAIIIGLMLGTLSLLWWTGLVFYFEGEYLEIPRVSIVLLACAGIAFAYSLRGTGDKDKAERWYMTADELDLR